MAIYERTTAGTVRSRLREFVKAFSGEPPTPEEIQVQLEIVQRARREVAAGHANLLQLLAPTAAADALGDPERIAAYAETLAVEAMINEAAGNTTRADALRKQALVLAREAQRRGRAPDSEIDKLVAAEGRLRSPVERKDR